MRHGARWLRRAVRLLALIGLVASSGAAPAAAQQGRQGPEGPAAATAVNVDVLGQLGGAVSTPAVQGGLAYVVVGPRLVVLDVSNPAAPVALGQSAPLAGIAVAAVSGGTLAGAASVAVAGATAYVAAGRGGLRVLDVGDPRRPVEIGALAEVGSEGALQVAVATVAPPPAGPATRTIVYVAAGAGGVRLVDVSDPAHPAQVAAYDPPGGAAGVALSSHYAYVAARGGALGPGGTSSTGVVILDVSNPAAPIQVGAYTIPANPPGAYQSAFSVAAAGDYAYVTFQGSRASSFLQIVDVADPAHPAQVAQVSGPAYRVAVAGATAYVAGGTSGLRVVDVSNPASPAPVGVYRGPEAVNGVAVRGTTAYVATGRPSGVRVVDASNPGQPAEVGAYTTLEQAQHVAASHRFAYVAESTALHVLDASDPANLVETGSVQMPPFVNDLVAANGLVYVAGLSGLRIVDVSDPAAPAEVGAYALPGQAPGNTSFLALAVAGHYAYVAAGTNGLRVVDVSDPVHPVEAGAYPGAGAAGAPVFFTGVAVGGGYAYAVGGTQLVVLDVSNPAAPAQVASVGGLLGASRVAVAGSYAYIIGGSGLRIFDVSDPGHPSQAGLAGPPAVTYDLVVAGSYAFVAAQDGLHVVDVSQPASPNEAGFFSPIAAARGVAPAGATLYVAGDVGGVWSLRFTAARPEGPVAAPLAPHDERYYAPTGFRVDHDPFAAYFRSMGGIDTFGFPVSRTFLFLGCTTQFFQRQLLQQCGPAAPVQTMNLLDPGLLPYNRINGSTFPAHDPAVASGAPAPTTPNYGVAVLGYIRAAAPDTFAGQPVNFFTIFVSTVPGVDPAADPDLAALVNLEVWGFPTSAPQVDPNNAGFVYQRFQRGIMHYDATTGVTRGILLADWLKALLTGRGLPPDLESQAVGTGSRFRRQYCPASVLSLCRPNDLPGTDLNTAFERQ